MKISQARIDFASQHQSEQLDAQINQRSQQEINLTRQRQRRFGQRALSRGMVDRISISQNQKKDIQSNYSAAVHSRSSVKSADSDVLTTFERHRTLEKIVGGIIDRQVTVRHLKRNEDIRGLNRPSDVPGNAPGKNAGQPDGQQLLRPNLINTTQSIKARQLSLTHTQLHFEQESAQFSSQGRVTTQDGRVIDFSLDMSLDRAFLSRTEEQTLVRQWQEQVNLIDPLVISLDGNAPVLTDTVFEFDLNNDGSSEHINFTGMGSGFLSLDKNADGVINNGGELFGPGTGNGFNELSAFDQDQNRWIDENDAVFSQLSVWTKDENGQDKLISLKDAGVGAIALDYADTMFNMTGGHNQLNGQMKQSGVFLFENGSAGSVHQIDLVSHDMGDNAPLKAEQPEIARIQSGRGTLGPDRGASSRAVSRPLQDLLDKIEDLKEKLTRLMDEMAPVSVNRPKSRPQNRSLYDFRDKFMMDSSILVTLGKRI